MLFWARGGRAQTYEAILDNVKQRDAIDSGRATAPLKAALDAVIIDSTGLSVDEVIARLEQHMAGER